MISRSRLAIIVAVFSLSRAALAAPTLGPETPFDSLVPTPQGAARPAVVWDGTQYVAVFSTDAFPSSAGAVRISSTGALLDPLGVNVALNSFYVSAAAGAGITLVATASGTATPQAAVVRLASDGTVMDATPIVLPYSTGAANLAASFDGTNFLVAATVASATLAWRITPAGEVLDANSLAIASGAVIASGFDGTSHVVLTGLGGPPYAVTRVTASGAVTPAGTISIAAPAANPDLAMACDDATGCVVLWTVQTGALAGSPYVVGSIPVGSTTSNTVSTSTSSTLYRSPAIAWDGSHYVAVWSTGNQALAVHLDAAGMPKEPTPIAIGPEGVSNARGVAAGPDSVLSVWDGVNGVLAPASLSGTGGGTFPVSIGPSPEEGASAASNGDGYLVAIASSGPSGGIFASRVSVQGSPLDAPPLSLAAGGDPAVASAGGAYLVTWQANRGIGGALLPATGGPGAQFSIVPPSTSSFGIVNNHLETATASQYLVGWLVQVPVDAGTDQLAEVARVGTDGTVMDANSLVLPGTFSTAFAVASDGANYLAVVANETGVVAVPIQSTSGTFGTPVQIANPASPTDPVVAIAVAHSGDRYLSVWTPASSSSTSAAFLDVSGTVLSPGVFTLPQPCVGLQGSLVALAGGFYLTCDIAQGVAPPGGTYEIGNLDGFAISSSGVVSPPDVLTTLEGIDNRGFSTVAPVLAMRDDADGLLVYNRMNASVAVPAFRVVTQTVAFSLDGGNGGGTADANGADGSISDATVDGSAGQDGAGPGDATTGADAESTDTEASADATVADSSADATQDAAAVTPDASAADVAAAEDVTPGADAARSQGGGGAGAEGGGGCTAAGGPVSTGGGLWALMTGVLVGRRRRVLREAPRHARFAT
jgi:hypothetical protein